MHDDFYSKFEDRFRGTRDLIKSRLEIYLPFAEPLKALHKQPSLLDLGCGRGEWLELSQGRGFQVTGVDLDSGMLKACNERKLNVICGDALKYLQGLPSESQDIISAFHVVEHIPFNKLHLIIENALRVLKPGGLLILETPNPENLVVGTTEFYMDPTHLKPLPSKLLEHLVKSVGFERVKVVYLQESFDLYSNKNIGLIDVLRGVSPDYGIIAQKQTTDEIARLFDAPFDRVYGITLNDLTERYDAQMRQIEEQLEDNKVKCNVASFGSQELNQRLSKIENETELEKENSIQIMEKIADIREMIEQLYHFKMEDGKEINITLHKDNQQKFFSSKKINSIFIFGKNNSRKFIYIIKNNIKTAAKYFIHSFFMNNRMRTWLLNKIKKHPRAGRHLYALAEKVGIKKYGLIMLQRYHRNTNMLKELSPRANKIYHILQDKNNYKE